MAARSRHRARGRAAEEVPPHAGRMTRSLQELGYDFPRALADVVDNSVSAEAGTVWIEIRSDDAFAEKAGPYVLVTDDGRGMGRGKLIEKMQYGSEPDADDLSLGRFGLGMKTASTSQADCLTVASRTTSGGKFHVRVWDLDHLGSRTDGRWVLLGGAISDLPPSVRICLKAKRGTSVLWTRLRPVLGKSVDDFTADSFNKRMNKLAVEASRHLSMVFHRFLDGSARRRRKLRILVNGHVLKPWDPLLVSHSQTKILKRRAFEAIDHEGVVAHFTATPAVLPRQDQFLDAAGSLDRDAHRAAGGPRGWAAQQGFYVYRLDRLIQGGGWSHMRSNDEHSKQARIAIDLDRSTDKVFRLNVAKTRVLFPADVRGEIKSFSAEIVSKSKKSYESGPSRGKGGGAKGGGVNRGTKQLLMELHSSCKTASERRILVRVVQRVYPGFKP